MNNFVYIETSNHTGSGVILKCEYETAGDCETYIILTNYHVLQDLEASKTKEQKNFVDLEIFDVNGEIIDPHYISHVYFASGNNYDYVSDVAALLVLVDRVCKVAYSNKVYFNYDEEMLATTIGYPHVMQDDLINRHLKLVYCIIDV